MVSKTNCVVDNSASIEEVLSISTFGLVEIDVSDDTELVLMITVGVGVDKSSVSPVVENT